MYAIRSYYDSDDVRLRLLTLLYENLSSSAIVILFNASIFVYVLWPVVEHTTLWTWFGSMSALTLLRFLDTLSFFKHHEHNYRHWYRRIFTGVALSALLWAMVSYNFV